MKVIHYLSKSHLIAEIGLFLCIWRFFKITVANLMSLSHSLKTLTTIKELCQFPLEFNKDLTLLEEEPRRGLLTWTSAVAILPSVFETWHSSDEFWLHLGVLWSSLPWDKHLLELEAHYLLPFRELGVKKCYLQFGNNRRKTIILRFKKRLICDSCNIKRGILKKIILKMWYTDVLN